jgi:hypothetical protein
LEKQAKKEKKWNSRQLAGNCFRYPIKRAN